MLETTITMMSVEEVQNLPVLELANEYPMLVDDQEKDLIASVEANGVREPLILFEGQLLDGRNRLHSAVKVKLEEIPVRQFVGTIDEAEDLIIDLNEKRRHLLPGQRAYIADRHRSIVEKRSEGRRLANLKQNQVAVEVPAEGTSEPQETGRTRDILAKKHNAGKNSIDTVQKIRRVSEEKMQDPDGEGEVLTPRAIKAQATLTKLQRGKINVIEATRSVFGEPGQDIAVEDPVAKAKARVGKVVNDLLNEFADNAKILVDLGSETEREFVAQKLSRLGSFVAKMNEKFGDVGGINLTDPDANRDYWNEVENEVHAHGEKMKESGTAVAPDSKPCGCSFSGVDFCADCK